MIASAFVRTTWIARLAADDPPMSADDFSIWT
jgi:hypothetical protein